MEKDLQEASTRTGHLLKVYRRKKRFKKMLSGGFTSTTQEISHGAERTPSPVMTKKSQGKRYQRGNETHAIEDKSQSVPGKVGKQMQFMELKEKKTSHKKEGSYPQFSRENPGRKRFFRRNFCHHQIEKASPGTVKTAPTFSSSQKDHGSEKAKNQ
jgi:hypothetical protein